MENVTLKGTKKPYWLIGTVSFAILVLLGFATQSAYSSNHTIDSPNFTGNVSITGASTSQPSIWIKSTPNASGMAHGGNIIFFYERTNPQLYDTTGYLYWYIRNSAGNLADAGEFKLMNISNTAGAVKQRFLFAATWNNVLRTLGAWDWENGLMAETPIRLASSGNSLHFRTDTEIAPSNTITPVGWIPVKLKDGSTGKIPVYK